MKKVMLTGPIGGFYGRDIEVNLVAKALQSSYELSFFSTGKLYKNTVCNKNIKNAKTSNIRGKLIKNPVLLFFAFVSWVLNGFKLDLIDYSKNKINSKLINLFDLDLKILESEIKDKDLVVCFVQLSSSYLVDIIKICNLNHVKIVIRTTGSINAYPIDLDLVKKVDLFIHHSSSNKNNLERFSEHNCTIIDQSTTLENKLLNLKNISNKENFVFGFAGRLDKKKGILEIIEIAIKFKIKLLIAGEGELKDIIKKKSQAFDNISYLGYLDYNQLNKFYEKIDVFVINSKTETGPLTGLEAMCASRFIMSTKVGAMPERLDGNENIWIEDCIEDSIKEFFVMKNEDIIEKSLKNREIYLNKFTLNIIKS